MIMEIPMVTDESGHVTQIFVPEGNFINADDDLLKNE
ncbi:hypothetical protein D1B33_05280 [Lysinibacillus yapensis]|uniref:Uncharacterized protein n=1 Tax=Ureibacillus yapensis TaxID=2304605 RepID=A0A396SAE3_9BACL|nr:hypothetical protein D1B33_05280 [Lysinibacillus yapensis]